MILRTAEKEGLDDSTMYRSVITDRKPVILYRDISVIQQLLWRLSNTLLREVSAEGVNKMAFPRELKIMDVGCAGGELVCNLLESLKYSFYNPSVTLIDPNSESLSLASQRLRKVRVETHTYCTKTEDLELDEKFDLIMCTRAVHHLREPQQVIERLYYLLKPRGVMYVSDLIRPDTEQDLEKRLKRRLKILNHPSTQSLAEQSLRASYTLLEIQAMLSIIPGSLRRSEDWFERWEFISSPNNTLFICENNVGRSQMAQAFFNQFYPSAFGFSSGVNTTYTSQPLLTCGKNIVEIMNEEGIDLSLDLPRMISPEIVKRAKGIVSFIPEKLLPDYCLQIPHRTISIDDPKGIEKEKQRIIRDQIKKIIEKLDFTSS